MQSCLYHRSAAAVTGRFRARSLCQLYCSMSISISSAFDGGNIEVVKVTDATAELTIRDDPFTESEKKLHKQWFFFRASGVKGKTVDFRIVNADDVSYACAWKDYKVCTSFDRKDWTRTDTVFSEGTLSWTFTSPYDQVYFSYFAPYSMERHWDLIAKCSLCPFASVTTLGNTLDGRPLDMVTLGTGPRKLWFIARQHPGETMAEWFLEGLLNALTDRSNALAQRLLTEATFYCVPNMNPDGSFRGHLRTNACGANLNREWRDNKSGYAAPTLERSPEVYYVLNEVRRVGCDLFVDVHGDEELPYNFLSGMEGCPNYTPRLENLQNMFSQEYMKTTYGYPADPPMKANLTVCSNHITAEFDCLAFTLEQPFKDTHDTPDPVRGWSPERAMQFGASILYPTAHVLPHLRD